MTVTLTVGPSRLTDRFREKCGPGIQAARPLHRAPVPGPQAEQPQFRLAVDCCQCQLGRVKFWAASENPSPRSSSLTFLSTFKIPALFLQLSPVTKIATDALIHNAKRRRQFRLLFPQSNLCPIFKSQNRKSTE